MPNGSVSVPFRATQAPHSTVSPRGPSSVGRTQATIVIPTWNGLDLLRGALASLEEQAFRDFETVVVDNGSTDGTVEWLRQNRPSVRIVTFSENRGFAAAVNAGIRTAEGEILVLMNNDVEAEPAWLGALVAGLDRHSEVGVCASKMLCWADPARIDSAGDDLGLLAFSIGHGAPDSSAFREARYVFSACAGAAAYRRSVLDDVGLFDERFYAYLEDVDLGARIQMAGWRCLYVPDAVVYHRGSATADRLPSFKLRLLLRNSLFLFFQYMP
ncbi:MAG: glycosyltransferase family 2 protein, partial [Acidobacteriota bacterium]